VDHPVAKTMEAKQKTTSGVGLGTPVTGYLGRLSGFKLGAFSFGNVPVSCGGATEQTSRLIGGEILHRFTLIFDYPHKRIFLEPNRYFSSNF
jgi:hypothetical protein